MPPPVSQILWYKADAGVYKDAGSTLCGNGDLVYQVADQSGNSNTGANANHGDATYCPVWRSSSAYTPLSGLPVMDFVPAGSGYLSTPLTLTAPFTIALVFGIDDPSTTRRVLDGIGANWLIGVAGGKLGCLQGGWTSLSSAPVPVANQLYRAVLTNDGSASQFLVDTVDYTTDSTQVTDPGAIGLGAIPGGHSQLVDGPVGEVLIYNRVLSGSEITTTFAYLNRWLVAPSVSGGPFPWFLDQSHCGGFADMGY